MSEIKVLTRDDILAADDRPRQLVEVPEWGGAVWVRALSGLDRNVIGNYATRKSGEETAPLDWPIRLCAMCITDEQGKRLFQDADVKRLAEKSPIALDRVFKVALEINGLQMGAVQEAAKNSLSNQSDASASA